MNVLVIEGMNPSAPAIGGSKAYSINLIEFLSKIGIGITLLGFCRGNKTLLKNKFTFVSVANKTSMSGYEFLFRLFIKIPLLNIPVSTIIHAQRPEYILPFVFFHRKNPRMVTLHGRILEGIIFKRSKIVSLIYKTVEYYALKHSHVIIAVDEGTKEFYQRQYPKLVTKIQVIPIGIDLSKFRLLNREALRHKLGFKSDDKVVAYVGRLVKEKNIDFLLKSFTLLLEAISEALLIIIGEGSDRERLERLVRSLNLKNVIFMGAQESNKIPEILNCADVLALCSLYEGSPTVVKEALACGVPVVSTNVGDVSNIIKNETIGQITSENVARFSHALIVWLRKEDRENVRKECANTAAKFSFENIATRTVALYNELLTEKRIKERN